MNPETEIKLKTNPKQREAIDRYILKNKDNINKKNLERHNANKDDPIYCEKIKQQNLKARKRYLEKKKANKPAVILVPKNSELLTKYKEGVDWEL